MRLCGSELEPKLARIAETGAQLVATGNPGCLMQIGAGLRREGNDTRVIHPVDLLDASYSVHASGGVTIRDAGVHT
jgi:Fe-S oxidoreductase